MVFRSGVITLITLLSVASAGAAVPKITADGLVLIVNKRQPAGRTLAERYAELRHVPAGRIVEIDVPDDVEISPEIYEESVAKTVRDQIDARKLRESVQCLVTFYGVPLRVRDRAVTGAETNEAALLYPAVEALRAQFKRAVESMEAAATELDPSFKPDEKAVATEQLRQRAMAAEKVINAATTKLDAAGRASVQAKLTTSRDLLQQMPHIANMPDVKPTSQPSQAQIKAWIDKPDDPEARRRLRTAVYFNGNVFEMLTVAEAQHRRLFGGQGEASIDSELSCLWLDDYSRQGWVTNPWKIGASDAAAAPPSLSQSVRVARIDGPTPEIAKRVIEESIAAEDHGLTGDVVIDARGMPDAGAPGSYNAGDRGIRNVAKYIGGVEGLKAVFDNGPELMADHSSDRAAIYCGWYSVRKYRPTAKFVPGSIAWHLASYEMISLRSPMETGWCRGLMLDGADVTLGPVGEPYVIAFPPADELLSLVMTGKPTLAEAYWATVPVTSWKMVLIGDPLYRPFAKKPAVEKSQLAPAAAKWLSEYEAD